MVDLVSEVSNVGFREPDAVWIADGDGLSSVFGNPYVPNQYWANHQRLHQYQGGNWENYGGVRINVDNDAVDGPLAGQPLGLATVGRHPARRPGAGRPSCDRNPTAS